MKKIEKITRLITYAGSVAMLIYFILQCSRSKELLLITDHIIHTDTVEKPTPSDTITNYVIRWRTGTDPTIIPDTNFVILIDSAKCLELAKNYYSTFVYNRTLIDDSLLTFQLTDSVNQNQLQSGIYSYKINRPMQIVSSEKMFIFGAMSDTKGFSFLGGYNSNNWIYYGGYDVMQKRVNFGIFKKF